MLKKSKEIAPRISQNLRGGTGEVYTYDFLTKEESGDKGRLFGKMVLPKGASIGMHRHEGEYEIYYVISGTGVVNDGSIDYVIEPGDMYLCEDGKEHLLYNSGSEDLVIIAIILFT